MVDIKIDENGELVLDGSNDLSVVSGAEYTAQTIMFKMKTYRGDYLLSPSVGCSLEDFIGQPNTEVVHSLIRSSIYSSIVGGFIGRAPDIYVRANGENSVFILIEFEDDLDSRFVQIITDFDLKTGEVQSRISQRDL